MKKKLNEQTRKKKFKSQEQLARVQSFHKGILVQPFPIRRLLDGGENARGWMRHLHPIFPLSD